jgi:uracil-DNA glycosylase
VFGRGAPDAPILLVGEAPGQNEDEKGEPFVGKAGEHLNEMLKAARIPGEALYTTNVLKCRPPKNKFPEDDELACTGFLKKQIELLKPLLIVLTGKQALKHLLLPGTGLAHDPFTPWVGKHLRRRDRFDEIRFAVIYHPSYLLRNQSPEDEETCVATLSDAWLYVQARMSAEPAPALPLEDLATAPPPMWQARSLWR